MKDLPLLPRPHQIEVLEGSSNLAASMSIAVAGEFATALEVVAERLRQGTGWRWAIIPEAEASATDIVVTRTGLGPEAFALSITAGQIHIEAGDAAGAFYAGQTLLQLLPAAIFNGAPVPGVAWTLPHLRIQDQPRFRWRGVMLDSVRHFQPISYIRKFIDLLAQHRLNVFHWHLTDDQGWRLEIAKYPQLTKIGSRRRGSTLGHLSAGAGDDGVPVEGFYTQAEVRELIQYAAARNVAILPEIEMPGHAMAAVASYPQLGCLPDNPPEVATQWGIHDTLFNIKPETISFLQDVLEEVTELFPFEFVHIGGDEAVKNQWRADADTQARMKALGIPDESRLQSWFIGQMATFLQNKGKRLIGWDEILEGGLPTSASVMSWRGKAGAIEAAEKGHDAVMSTNETYYFDYAQGEHAEEPLAIGGKITLRKVYESSPVPPELTPAQAAHVIGVQGQLWTEYIPTTSRLEYMAFPRVCALAEIGWSPAEGRDYAEFSRRLALHLKRLDCQDVRYRALDD